MLNLVVGRVIGSIVAVMLKPWVLFMSIIKNNRAEEGRVEVEPIKWDS